jgi:hypothetical protein
VVGAVSGDLGGILASITRQVTKIMADMGKVAIEGSEFGAKTAQSYTASRPGATTGKAGRVDTGEMIEAIRSKPVSFSLDLIEVQYGFVNEAEEYFGMQTVTGFSHNRSGDYIAPTFALRDSIEPTRAYLIARAGDVV